MIRTDGRPTIASYGTPLDTPVRSEDVTSPATESQLLEREAAGIKVELVLIADNLVVRITQGEDVKIGVVPPAKARDAFDHPYLYV